MPTLPEIKNCSALKYICILYTFICLIELAEEFEISGYIHLFET